MKVTIGAKTYTAIKDLSFAPEADVTGDSVPINEFQVDIHTTDSISIGQYAELYDDLDTLWAKYWIVYAERLDKSTVRVRAQSVLKLLERRTMPAVMYTNEPIEDVLADIFTEIGSGGYALDSSYDNAQVHGWCPEQTAKDRLQWVCFILGAYVKSSFTDKVEILPIGETETLIPINKTFWKPSVTYTDYVTAISITAYSYLEATPDATDEWVTDGTTYWIVYKQVFTLANPDAPAAAPTNVIAIDGMTMVNNTNVSGILSRLSQYYFKRMQVDLDAVDNAEFTPGQRVVAYTDESSMAAGYINSATFSFGVQARAKLHITPVEAREAASLVITYQYPGDSELGQMQLDRQTYVFPVGYAYDIDNPYIDLSFNAHRYIFRPLAASASGTIQSGGNTDTENYAKALDLYDGTLKLYSVDNVAMDEDEPTVAVIS